MDDPAQPSANESRLDAARHRSRLARIALATAAAAVFGAGVALTRASAPGHAATTPTSGRHRLQTPPSYLRQLDQSSIQPGTIAPPQAPSQQPPAATGQS